jgi:hypothetical protein
MIDHQDSATTQPRFAFMVEQPTSPSRKDAYIYAFDVAHDLKGKSMDNLLGQPGL